MRCHYSKVVSPQHAAQEDHQATPAAGGGQSHAACMARVQTARHVPQVLSMGCNATQDSCICAAANVSSVCVAKVRARLCERVFHLTTGLCVVAPGKLQLRLQFREVKRCGKLAKLPRSSSSSNSFSAVRPHELRELGEATCNCGGCVGCCGSGAKFSPPRFSARTER